MHTSRWIRKVDTLGRVVIPMDIRRELGIVKQDAFSLSSTEQGIILHQIDKEQCGLCGSKDSLVPYRDSFVCIACRHELKSL
ncbi:transcriptional pleiotropic regulator of transition state genes [Paenibacillus sp. RC254]